LVIGQDLLREFDIAFRALGADVVEQDGFAMAGRLGEFNVAGDNGLEHFVLEEVLQILGYLPGEIGPVIVHGEEDSFGTEVVGERFLNALYGVHELGDSFEGKELTLNGNKDRICSDESVEGK
jgi:hypothetical protein